METITRERALVVVNGELPPVEAIHRLQQVSSLTICTDGAADKLLQLGVDPEIIIGDLDSLDPTTRLRLPPETIIEERPSQYATDFEKALDYAFEKGCTKLALIGLKGGRFDHAFTNLSILRKYRGSFSLQVFDEDGFGVLCCEGQKSISLAKFAPETIVSLLPLPTAYGVTTAGLLYPISNEDLVFGEREGQSNQVLDHQASISISDGVLLVFVIQWKWWEQDHHHFF